jgi:molybdenum transport protein
VIYIGDDVIERIIHEDVPSLDLTTWTLGLRDVPGTMRCLSREDIVVCGAQEASRICDRFGVVTARAVPAGQRVGVGDVVFEAVGDVASLHRVWRACLKVMETCSGIATRTARLVERARQGAPEVEVLTSRKWFPGTRELSVKAIVAGGALPHRLGLSETVLVFEQHRTFLGGIEGLVPRIADIHRQVPEKKVIVEVEDLDEALTVLSGGADGVQFDKVAVPRLAEWVRDIRRDHPGSVLLAAGGITESNARDHAATGVDGLVTSTVFSGRPVDLGTEIRPE